MAIRMKSIYSPLYCLNFHICGDVAVSESDGSAQINTSVSLIKEWDLPCITRT